MKALNGNPLQNLVFTIDDSKKIVVGFSWNDLRWVREIREWCGGNPVDFWGNIKIWNNNAAKHEGPFVFKNFNN